jgi:hypothetical protein
VHALRIMLAREMGVSLTSQWVTSASTHMLVHPELVHNAGGCHGFSESHENVTAHGDPDFKQRPPISVLRCSSKSAIGAEPTCQLLFSGRMASSLSLESPRTPPAANRPMRKDPNILDGRSGKYAPKLL